MGWIEGRDVVVQPKMERKGKKRRVFRREWAKRVCIGSWELNWNFDGGLGLGGEFFGGAQRLGVYGCATRGG
jgi:hypothetical protein